MADDGGRHGLAADVVLRGRDQELFHEFAHHHDRLRRGLDVYCRMDRSAAFLHSGPRWRAAAGPLRGLSLFPTRLVGEHRHGGCVTPANAHRAWHERCRPPCTLRWTAAHAGAPATWL